MELLFILLLLLLLVIPQFLLQRKQKAHMQKLQAMQDSLSIGDHVVVGAGMHAVVSGIAEETVELDTGDGSTSTWEKAAVIRNVTAEQAAAPAAAETAQPQAEAPETQVREAQDRDPQ